MTGYPVKEGIIVVHLSCGSNDDENPDDGGT